MEREDLGWIRLRFAECPQPGRGGESRLKKELGREVPERVVVV